MSAYQTVFAILNDVAEEPRTTTLEILGILRAAPPEVLATGMNAEQWAAACDAMIKVANDAVDKECSAEAAARRKDWAAMKPRLEKGGCHVTQQTDDVWRVEGPGVQIDVNLRSGQVDHAADDMGEQLPRFDRIEGFILHSVAHRIATKKDLARRAELGKTHRWDNSKKVWLLRNGLGPVIKGGQSQPGG